MLKIGDTIKCSDVQDMVNHMELLATMGIETDFLYEKDSEKGYWLVITNIER